MKRAAATRSTIAVEGEATLEIDRDGRRCSMNVLDLDVRRSLASVGAIVDEGNSVVFGAMAHRTSGT